MKEHCKDCNGTAYTQAWMLESYRPDGRRTVERIRDEEHARVLREKIAQQWAKGVRNQAVYDAVKPCTSCEAGRKLGTAPPEEERKQSAGRGR